MKRINLIIVSILFFYSCSNQEFKKLNQPENLDEQNTQVESVKGYVELSDPINIVKIKNIDWLTTTSGVITHSEAKKLCFYNDTIGFHGFYFLIDKSIGIPFGMLKIYSEDKTGNWNFDNKNDRFVEINLKSNKIAVWDSIRVGLSESDLRKFIGNRFNYTKGSMIYSNLDDYTGVFTILGDTINELTIGLNCKN